MTYQDLQSAPLPDYGRWSYRSTSTDPVSYSKYENSEADYVQRFQLWVRAWERETRFSSAFGDYANSIWINRIVGLGSKAVPLVIQSIRGEPSFLFVALPRLIGVDPVPDALYGDVDAICRFWVDWLEQNDVEEG